MALKEIEAIYSELDAIKRYNERNGKEMPYYHNLSRAINDEVTALIDGFNESVTNGRELTKLARDVANGNVSFMEYNERQAAILERGNEAELKKENALRNLSSYAESLGAPDPSKGITARQFARDLVGEYDSFQHAYDRAYTAAVQEGIPFVISEHAPYSMEIMEMANESAKRVREAIKEGAIPDDIFADVQKYRKIGTGEFRVRSSLGNVPFSEPKEFVRGVIDVIRFDNGKKDSVFVPATYLPERGYYVINRADFDRIVVPVGKPIAKIDISRPGNTGGTSFDARAISIMKEYGYSGKTTDKNIRQWLLKSMLDEGIISKPEMQQYFSGRINMAKNNKKLIDQYPALKEDQSFVDAYVPKLDRRRQRQAKDIDIRATKGKKGDAK